MGIIILPIFIFLLVIIVIISYNRMMRSKAKLDKKRSNIRLLLKKRKEFIPDLLEEMKGFVPHEDESLEKVIQDCNQALSIFSVDMKETSNANQQVHNSLNQLMAFAENLPGSQSRSYFIELKNSLQNIETDLKNAALQYNESVKDYNRIILKFPTSLLVSLAGNRKQAFFETSDSNKN